MLKPVLACLLLSNLPGLAAAQAARPSDQVVAPQVERRNVKPPRLPSNDFEIGLFAGTYATQNFGSSAVYGLRLGYHITEDVFVEAAYGQTKVSDELFRQVYAAGIFPTPSEKLTYYNLSVGYNLLPGEIFFSRNIAKASSFYLIGGIGSTRFVDKTEQTFNVGFGMRVLFNDWIAMQFDVRNHIFSQDLLSKRQTTQNPEITLGLTIFF
ncbi:MAG: outer membrane beta-barrel domain-containing protein [Rubrivivax sp.]